MKKYRILTGAIIISTILMGAGYAAWTDKLVLTSTVKTGELEVVYSDAVAVGVNEESYNNSNNDSNNNNTPSYQVETRYYKRAVGEIIERNYESSEILTYQRELEALRVDFEVEIITNYWSSSKNIGYIKYGILTLTQIPAYEEGCITKTVYIFNGEEYDSIDKIPQYNNGSSASSEQTSNYATIDDPIIGDRIIGDDEQEGLKEAKNKQLTIGVRDLYPGASATIRYTMKNEGTIPAVVDDVQLVATSLGEEQERLLDELKVTVFNGAQSDPNKQSGALSELAELLKAYYKDLRLEPEAGEDNVNTKETYLKIEFPINAVKGDELEGVSTVITVDISWRQHNSTSKATPSETTL